MDYKSFKVFVIGPMFREGEGPGGIKYSDQIYNIVRAINAIGADLQREHGIHLDVDAPDRRIRDIQNIPDFALGEIDLCDFAVADISGRSPSVMYEIAILHALGTPTLLIDQNPAKIEDAVYYLKDLMVRGVDSFSQENVQAELKSPIGVLTGVEESGRQDYTLNKISEYYRGVPLVDIRALTGIATSYYANFLRHVLHPFGPLASDHTLDRLVVLTPSMIIDNNGATVKSRLKAELGDRLELLEFQSVFSRASRADRIGNTILDYPTPIDSLSQSLQFQRVADRLTLADPDGKGAEAFARYQQRMISTFCDIVNNLCTKGDAIKTPEFVPLENFVNEFNGDTDDE
ncbi:MAG: hypothetical protein ABJX35_01660 [Hyphomicrobiales bacterium]